MTGETVTHRELRCRIPGCTFDMRDDPATQEAVALYLDSLVDDVYADKVRHISVSVHRAESIGKSGL